MNGEKEESNRLTLALGEGSNTHILESKKEKITYSFPTEDKLSINFKVRESAVLTHEEHGTIVLPSGEYLKEPQVEYDPFEHRVRTVYD